MNDMNRRIPHTRYTVNNGYFRYPCCVCICLLMCFIASCSGHHGKESKDSDTADTAQPDLQEVEDIDSEPDSLVFENAADFNSYLQNSPDRDKYRQGILPGIAANSLDYATRLINSKYPGFIVVDKSRMKVLYFDKFGREQKCYGMACAKNYGTKHKRRDSRTPEGFFTVEGKYDSTEWLFTDDDGHTSDKKGQFGPRFIRLKIPVTTQIGIHGTCAPWSIGHRTSHGCIRILNENILELVEIAEVGMPVIVIPGKRDRVVNKEEGVESVWFPTTLSAPESGASADTKSKQPSDTTDTVTNSVPMSTDTMHNESETIKHVDSEVQTDSI